MEADKEIKHLKKVVRKLLRYIEWEGMAKAYHPNVAQVNLGKRPNIPVAWYRI